MTPSPPLASNPTNHRKPRKHIRVKDLPSYQRPRERLEQLGAANVATVELLAVVLGRGRAGSDVLQLAQAAATWLQQAGNEALPAQTTTVPGLGRAHNLTLIAVHELCRRAQLPTTSLALHSPQAIVQQLLTLGSEKQEKVYALYLDANLFLIEKRLVAVGRQNAVQLEPRDIFAPALTLPAHGVVLAHNHPSGSAEPSDEDIQCTQRVIEAGKILGVQLVDHIILTKKNWYSFGEHGFDQTSTA